MAFVFTWPNVPPIENLGYAIVTVSSQVRNRTRFSTAGKCDLGVVEFQQPVGNSVT
ncbi:hypothetical protein [Halobacillus dabanensis]|uniref:hypothetical protein n=1 Tax=Halobacillus dabanensis TaxID=240302 RepID=UPI001428B6D7|nr:hypothetical protein [Halobacillus dabanensis]